MGWKVEEEGIKTIVVFFAFAIGIIIVLLKVFGRLTESRSSVVMPLLFLVLVGIGVYMYMTSTPRVTRISGNMDDAKRAINSLLTTARMVAERHCRSAGVRFQQTENGKQYAIMIIREPNLPFAVDADDPNCIFFPFVAMPSRRTLNLGSNITIASERADERVSVIFSSAGTLSKIRVMMKANPNLANDWLYGPPGLFDEESIGYLSDMTFFIYDRKQLEAYDNEDEFFRTLKTVIIKPEVGAIFR